MLFRSDLLPSPSPSSSLFWNAMKNSMIYSTNSHILNAHCILVNFIENEGSVHFGTTFVCTMNNEKNVNFQRFLRGIHPIGMRNDHPLTQLL